MDILENNKLIAEFMGAEIGVSTAKGEEVYVNIPVFGMNTITSTTKHMRFNSSWNWLMPVVEKIEDCGADLEIGANYVNLIYDEGNMTNIFSIKGSKIFYVYEACVKFIKWYNEQNK